MLDLTEAREIVRAHDDINTTGEQKLSCENYMTTMFPKLLDELEAARADAARERDEAVEQFVARRAAARYDAWRRIDVGAVALAKQVAALTSLDRDVFTSALAGFDAKPQ